MEVRRRRLHKRRMGLISCMESNQLGLIEQQGLIIQLGLVDQLDLRIRVRPTLYMWRNANPPDMTAPTNWVDLRSVTKTVYVYLDAYVYVHVICYFAQMRNPTKIAIVSKVF